MNNEPIKPGEMGIIKASIRNDLQFIVGAIVTCIRYAQFGERFVFGNFRIANVLTNEPCVVVEHPIHGVFPVGVARIIPIRPTDEDEHIETEKELESVK